MSTLYLPSLNVRFSFFCPEAVQVLVYKKHDSYQWVQGQCTISATHPIDTTHTWALSTQDFLDLVWTKVGSRSELTPQLSLPSGTLQSWIDPQRSFCTGDQNCCGLDGVDELIVFLAVPISHRGDFANQLAPNDPDLYWDEDPVFTAMYDTHRQSEILSLSGFSPAL